MRRLGVYGDNLPTKKSKVIEPADFTVGGIHGLFERKYNKTFLVNNPSEFSEIFGNNIFPTFYGWDAVQGFFDNLNTVRGKLYIKSHVGNDGTDIDAVVASSTALDGAGENLLEISAAYQEEDEYGTSGNRTAYKIENGTRFTTAIKTATTKDNTYVIVDSVSDIKVGDILKVVSTGGGGATVYKEITEIDESSGKVSFADAFDGAANPEVDDVVTIPGFKIKTYRKTLSGVEKEVDVELGKQWLTMQNSVTDYYVENVFAVSKWIKVTDLDPTTVVGADIFPAEVATAEYLTGGDNGTSPTTAAHWSLELSSFDDDPIRMLCNPETTLETVNKAGETYCQNRTDNPKWIYNISSNQTKAQLQTIGSLYQRSDDVLGVIVANWLEKDDPFATAVNAPKREIPNVGHVMGNWIRSIGQLGIHYIPAVPTNPLLGVTGVVGNTFLDDNDRTDLADAGINVIQNVSGTGIVIKNFFTPSTTKEFKFANGILMREFIKISVVNSLSDTENEPNNFDRIQNSRSAVVSFMTRLWRVGSTGNVPEGETFGQTIDPETGQGSSISDHFQVQADIINNPQASIEAGERNIDTWFTYPSPAGSIKIGVGLMLLGN